MFKHIKEMLFIYDNNIIIMQFFLYKKIKA